MTSEQQAALAEYRAAALSTRYATASALATGLAPDDLMREAMHLNSVPLTGPRPPLVECPDCGTHLAYVPDHLAGTAS